MDNFNTERFIEEVENRPPLWDCTIEEYSKRELKKQCWDDIVDIFGGSDLKRAERRDMELALQKKWKCIRGCFTRELKRQGKLKAGGDPGPRKSEYTYFQQLQFLNKVVTSRDDDPQCIYYDISDISVKNEDSNDDPLKEGTSRRLDTPKYEREEEQEDEVVDPRRTKKPRYELEEVEENEDRMFLLSMLSTLRSIPTSKKMATKIKLMTVLDEAMKDTYR